MIIFSFLAGLTIGFGAFPATAEILETSLTIGDPWTVVRELRRVPLRVGEQELVFDRIPEEADLSTLTLRTRRGLLDLREWERVGVSDPAGPLERTSGDAVVWRPSGEGEREAPREEDRTGAVRCRVHTLLSGTRTVELTYRVQGLSWRAEYQAMIRGGPEETGETVSVDFSGALHIRNDTSHDYEGAAIRLVGSEPPEPDDRSYAGFLVLEEGPLAALWDPPEPEFRPEHLYRLPEPVTLPAQSVTEIIRVPATRVPARRRHVLDADDIPLTWRGRMKPVREILVFGNLSDRGPGTALPPGSVVLSADDVARRPARGKTRLSYTPVHADVRIDLGPDERVLGQRRTVRRTAVVDGHYEETFEIAIQNNRSDDIVVEIHERPHRALSWDVVRAGAPYTREPHRLHFDLTVPGGSDRRLEYRLRFHQPAW